MKKFERIIILFVVVLAVIWCAINAWTFFFTLREIFTYKKTPQITYGEFPFYVEYEVNGERHIIEDTIICEFAGFDHSLGLQTRMWRTTLKSGDEDKCILISEENSPSVLTPKRTNTLSRLVLDYGSSEYYMGDPEAWSMIDGAASFEYRERWNKSEKISDIEYTKLNKKELEKHFGIKVIRFEFAKPIENKFK